MKKVKIVLQGYECIRCKHQWIPNVEHPKICPACKSAYWDTKPRNKKRGNKKDEINN